MQLPDDGATQALGAALSLALVGGEVVYLCGTLGAGKTTLVRGCLRSLGYAGSVKSPTYTLVELYPLSPINFHHFDFYRLDQSEEYLDAGLDEYFLSGGVCLVEWPDKAAPYVPEADLRIKLFVAGTGRAARLAAYGTRGRECLTRLIEKLPAGLRPSRDADF